MTVIELDNSWISGSIDENRNAYLPLDFAECLLNGKKQKYVIVTRCIARLATPDGERVFFRCILIFSWQDFKKLYNKIETDLSLTDGQRTTLLRIFIAPARKCLLRNNGRIAIHFIYLQYTGISSDVWFMRDGSKILIVGKPFKPISKNEDQ